MDIMQFIGCDNKPAFRLSDEVGTKKVYPCCDRHYIDYFKLEELNLWENIFLEDDIDPRLKE